MDLPVLLLLRPKKQIYTMAIVNELRTPINDFVGQTLMGNIAHFKYKKLPKFNEGSCHENHHIRSEDLNTNSDEMGKIKSEL